jgi:hypothetical protein
MRTPRGMMARSVLLVVLKKIAMTARVHFSCTFLHFLAFLTMYALA